MMKVLAFNFKEIDDILSQSSIQIIHINNELTFQNISRYLNTNYILLNKVNSLAFGDVELPSNIIKMLQNLDFQRVTITTAREGFPSEAGKISNYINSSIASVEVKSEQVKKKIDLNLLDFTIPFDYDVFIDLGSRYVKLYNKGELLDENDLRLRTRSKGVTDNIFYIEGKTAGFLNIIAKPNSLISKKRDLL